jgi:hypothetical protein
MKNALTEVIAGLLLLSTCIWISNKMEAHSRPVCKNGQCTTTNPTNEKWRKNQICDLIQLSDSTLLECAFEAETNQEKTACYSNVKKLDKQVVELQAAFKGSFGEYQICERKTNEL